MDVMLVFDAGGCIVWCLYDRVSASYEEEWQDQFHGAGTGRVKKSERYKGIH